ncbi:capsule biosynthesis protein [Amphritea sp.]|uniref:capsule biosynthesis protein n=1 Tax=Amphritea sp. TaxID=1872502 RepID=UPI003A90234D
MINRNFIFLQGPTSPFFSRLGDKLLEMGAKVYQVNFNMGDYFFWRNKPSFHFRKNVSYLPTWLEAILLSYKITDIILMGDTRPVNIPALPLSKKHNIRLHVFEEGYLRPNFITLEEGGVNAYSSLPKDPVWYFTVGPRLPTLQEGEPVTNPISLLAKHEISYHLPGLLNPLFYPGYRTHRPFISGIELSGWAYRFGLMHRYVKRDARSIESLIKSQTPFYLLPLQLDSDCQIKTHSPFKSMEEVIKLTMTSFALHAAKDCLLVIKNHPLDTGFTNFSGLIEQLEHELNICGRTLYLESGHLPTLLDHCQGTIVVNSTVGTSSIIHQCRTIALADAVYNIPGLTSSCSLNEFWNDSERPNMRLFRNFRKVMRYSTQLNGSLYSDDGIEISIRTSIERLKMTESPLQTLLKKFPLTPQMKSDEHSI